MDRETGIKLGMSYHVRADTFSHMEIDVLSNNQQKCEANIRISNKLKFYSRDS